MERAGDMIKETSLFMMQGNLLNNEMNYRGKEEEEEAMHEWSEDVFLVILIGEGALNNGQVVK